MTSIIITQHEESQAFVQECIDQIRSTIDIDDYEIIIVDDHSQTPLALSERYKDITIMRNELNIGVGRSFDEGVKRAKGKDLIIMACDIRFIINNWASRLMQEIDEHPKAIVCTGCVTLYQDDTDFDQNTKRITGHGATLLMYHDHESNKAKPKSYKSIIEAKWQPSKPEESYDIPCVLGAIYAVKKDWYNHIDGFWGHRQWGTLEPYISLKSWLFGGSCRIVKTIKTGHIFSRNIHNISLVSVAYNKLLVSLLLTNPPLRGRLIGFLSQTKELKKAMELISINMIEIEKKSQEYKSKTIYNIDDYCNRFDIDLRQNQKQSKLIKE